MAADLLGALRKSLCNCSCPAAVGQPGGWAQASKLVLKLPDVCSRRSPALCVLRDCPNPGGKWNWRFPVLLPVLLPCFDGAAYVGPHLQDLLR